MTQSNFPLPTDAELSILQVLWDRGPSTVRQVLEHLEREDIGYTTVLKLLQIMMEKGLVVRDESQRAHIYAAAVDRQKAERGLVGDLMDRAFGGSAQRLIQQALSTDRVSPEEMEQIRSILDELEEKNDD